MKIFVFILTSFIYCNFIIASESGMTLMEVRSVVLKNNPTVAQSLARIEAAKATLIQAKSTYYPSLSLKGNASATNASEHSKIAIFQRQRDSFNNAGGGIELSYLLFDGFARKARKLAAKYSIQQSQELADETRRLLLSSTTIAFRQAQLSKEKMHIAKQDKEFNLSLKKEAKIRYNTGSVPITNVYNFSIRALQANNAYLNAELNYKISCTVLSELMALPNTTLLIEQQPKSIVFNFPNKIYSLENEIKYALKHRPDYKSMTSLHNILEEQSTIAKSNYYPKLIATAGLNYTEYYGTGPIDQYGNHNSYAGITAVWDIFNGGNTKGMIKKSHAEILALDKQKEQLWLSIKSAIQQRLDSAITAKNICIQQQEIYKLSILVRDAVAKSYKAGVASITRLNEVQTDLVRAKGGYATAFIAYLLALNEIDATTGRILAY